MRYLPSIHPNYLYRDNFVGFSSVSLQATWQTPDTVFNPLICDLSWDSFICPILSSAAFSCPTYQTQYFSSLQVQR